MDAKALKSSIIKRIHEATTSLLEKQSSKFLFLYVLKFAYKSSNFGVYQFDDDIILPDDLIYERSVKVI